MSNRFVTGKWKRLLTLLLILCWLALFLLRNVSPVLTCILGVIALFGTLAFLAFLFTPAISSTVLASSARSAPAEPSPSLPVQPTVCSQRKVPLTAAQVHEKLSDEDFEFLAAAVVIVINGYQFDRHCGGRGDQGVDVLLVNQYGYPIAIQAKRYVAHRSIGSRQMREFGEGSRMYHATNGYFVTTSTFTKDALTVVRSNGFLHPIDGAALEVYLREHAEAIFETYQTIRPNGRTKGYMPFS